MTLVAHQGDLIHQSQHGQQYLNECFFIVGHCFLKALGCGICVTVLRAFAVA